MAMWDGVGYNIDSVFQWNDGKKKLTAFGKSLQVNSYLIIKSFVIYLFI